MPRTDIFITPMTNRMHWALKNYTSTIIAVEQELVENYLFTSSQQFHESIFREYSLRIG